MARCGPEPASWPVLAPRPDLTTADLAAAAVIRGRRATCFCLCRGARLAAGQRLRALMTEDTVRRQIGVVLAEVGARGHRPGRAAGAVIDLEVGRGRALLGRLGVARRRCRATTCRPLRALAPQALLPPRHLASRPGVRT